MKEPFEDVAIFLTMGGDFHVCPRLDFQQAFHFFSFPILRGSSNYCSQRSCGILSVARDAKTALTSFPEGYDGVRPRRLWRLRKERPQCGPDSSGVGDRECTCTPSRARSATATTTPWHSEHPARSLRGRSGGPGPSTGQRGARGRGGRRLELEP